MSRSEIERNPSDTAQIELTENVATGDGYVAEASMAGLAT
jgi:hypothetical protein